MSVSNNMEKIFVTDKELVNLDGMSAIEVISLLQQYEEKYSNVKFYYNYDRSSYDVVYDVCIMFDRLETDGEYAHRMKMIKIKEDQAKRAEQKRIRTAEAKKKRLAEEAAEKEKRDRELYEHLKAKFGK